jgi:HlyD family secretion protein
VADILAQRRENVVMVPNAALRFDAATASGTGASPGFLSRLLPHPPGQARKPEAGAASSQGSEHNLWVLRGGEPVAVSVRTGLSDGVHTEIASGLAPDGDAVILGLAAGK